MKSETSTYNIILFAALGAAGMHTVGWVSKLPVPDGDVLFKVGYIAGYAWNALAHLFS